MVPLQISEYVTQSRQQGMSDAQITEALSASGWDSDTVGKALGNSLTETTQSLLSRNYKKPLTIGGIIVVVIGLIGLAYAYVPFGGSVSNLFGTFDTKNIKSASYTFSMAINAEPRRAGAQSILEAIPSLKNEGKDTTVPFIIGAIGGNSGLMGFLPGNIKLDLALKGDATRGSKDTTDARLQVIGNANFDDFNLAVDASLLKKDKDVYLRIDKFPGLFIDLSSVKGYWIQFDAKDLAQTGLGESLDTSTASSSMSSQKTLGQIEQLIDLARSTNLLSSKGVKKDTVDNKTVYRIDIGLNKEQFLPFYKEWLSQTKGEKESWITPSDKNLSYYQGEEFSKVFDYLNQYSTLSIWVDPKTKNPAKLQYDFIFIPPDTVLKLKDKQIKLTFSIDLSHINESFQYDAPQDFKKFEDVQEPITGTPKEQYLQTKKSGLSSLETARQKARNARRIADISQIRTAAELYYDDAGHYPQVSSYDALKPLFVPKYLASLSTDPTNTPPYQYRYGHKGGTKFQISAKLEGWAQSLNSDADINSTVGGWVGQTINGAKDSQTDCADTTSPTTCIYDQGQN